MNTVLAALDTSPSAGEVLDTARRVARLTDATVIALHVRGHAGQVVTGLSSMADQAGVALRVVDGPPGPTLVAALRQPDAVAAVIGGCAPSRRAVPRAWPVARALLQRTDTPVVVVPSGSGSTGEIRRLLVPLEGSDVSSRSVLEQLVPLVAADVDIEVLHVFTATTVPTMLDQPTYDLGTLGREFLRHHFPDAGTIEFRTGAIVDQVARVCIEHHMDLIALSWSQSPSPERGLVIRGVLEGASRPVLLLPDASRRAPPSGHTSVVADVVGTARG